jgi:hypothetical protein
MASSNAKYRVLVNIYRRPWSWTSVTGTFFKTTHPHRATRSQMLPAQHRREAVRSPQRGKILQMMIKQMPCLPLHSTRVITPPDSPKVRARVKAGNAPESVPKCSQPALFYATKICLHLIHSITVTGMRNTPFDARSRRSCEYPIPNRWNLEARKSIRSLRRAVCGETQCRGNAELWENCPKYFGNSQ